MNVKLRTHVALGLGLIFLASSAFARGYSGGGTLREESLLVSNGQGVSSPGFWEGLNGQNPGGLMNNQRLKIQLGAATFDNSTNNARGSAALLGGNGQYAGGLEYSRYGAGPYGTNSAVYNGGFAFRLAAMNASFGLSAHRFSPNGGTSFDVGTLVDLAPMLRFGALIPDIGNGLHVLAGGFTYSLDPMVDVVADAAYQLNTHDGTVKPGLTLRTDLVQATAAYGLRLTGKNDVFLYSKFTAGVGLKLSDNILISYTYRGLPEHRLGLTLRMN